MRHPLVRAQVALAAAAALCVAFAVGAPATASVPASGAGGLAPGTTQVPGSTTAGAPAPVKAWTLHGGYVAAGVGLRNRGAGTVTVSGVPTGATVKAAYLYWSVLGGDSAPARFAAGRLNGTAVTGTMVGSGGTPCWGATTKGYAYRASVTSLVKGNGRYALSRFASGRTDGADPFTETKPVPPLAEGASLVVVYEKASYPSTRVVLANGYGLVGVNPSLSTTIPFGFAASSPVGQVRTTFIGADGQGNYSEPASTVDGTAVPRADWDGTDGPSPAYRYGNLWDTDTAPLVNVVRPGDTSARVTVNGGPDCLAWVAQVFSIGVDGRADTDHDALLDGWEANGYDANGDGVIDVDLPRFGASVVRKDLFVEMDYMGAEAKCPCHLPQAADLNRIKAVFAAAPQAANPNGATGINLHLDAGPARGAAFDLGGGNLVPHDDDLNPVATEFAAIKQRNFNPLRARIFYYMVWAHDYDGDSSSGNAFNIPSDSFVVTLGSWPSHGTSDQKVGTFVHEFGHALGQKHGGDDHANFEPNYLSVMNYAFQTTGVPRTGTRPPYFGYSSARLPTLDENALNETVGLHASAASTYKTRWFCPNGSFVQSAGRADTKIDWSCNGKLSTSVRVDLNDDGARTKLGSWNNWGHLVYGGGQVGAGQSYASQRLDAPLPDELTREQLERFTR